MLVIGILLCLFVVYRSFLLNCIIGCFVVFDVPILVSMVGLLEGLCLCPIQND